MSQQFPPQYPQQPMQPGHVPQQQQFAPPAQYPPQPSPYYQQQPAPGYYPPQQPMYQPYMQQPMMQANVQVNVGQQGPGFFVRALYFCAIGWWAGFFCLNLGFALCVFLITLPAGLMILNRMPQIMTLKPVSSRTSVSVSTTTMQGPMGPMMQQNVMVNVSGTQQVNFFIRALYYLFVGWWVGGFWAYIAYGCCLTIILLPVGVLMFDRLPAVLTLRKN